MKRDFTCLDLHVNNIDLFIGTGATEEQGLNNRLQHDVKASTVVSDDHTDLSSNMRTKTGRWA